MGIENHECNDIEIVPASLRKMAAQKSCESPVQAALESRPHWEPVAGPDIETQPIGAICIFELIFGTRQKYASITAENRRMTSGSAGKPWIRQTPGAGQLRLQAIRIFSVLFCWEAA